MKLPKVPEGEGPPQTLRDKIYQSTPVILAVIATVLAGLSSGEMTRAQYFRSFAAQQQSKASDQWAYFQAKKSRSAMYQSTFETMQATAHPRPLDAGAIAATLMPYLQADLSVKYSAAFAPLDKQLPEVSEKPVGDEKISQALKAVGEDKSETEMAPLLRQITDPELAQAMVDANDNAKAFDLAIKPASNELDDLYQQLSNLAAKDQTAPAASTNSTGDAGSAVKARLTDVSAARLLFNAARSDREAKYYQVVAELFEVQVHRSGVISERHQVRSSYFFYGMLGAQAGVTIATLALAMRKKSVFWSLATGAGLLAVTFSAYIYLFM